MTDRTVVRLLRAAVFTGGTLAVTGSAMLIATGHAETWYTGLFAFVTLFSVFFSVFVWLVIPQQPRNAVVWTMAAPAFLGGLWIAGLAVVSLIVEQADAVLDASEHVVPADLPAAVTWILMVAEPSVNLAFFALMTFGLLLFPDGRLPSPRWRWVGWLTAAILLLGTVSYAWGFRPSSHMPADQSASLDLALMGVFVASVASLAALVLRFRRSRGATRAQFKWIVWGAAIFVPTFVFGVALGGTKYEDLTVLPLMVGGAVFLTAYGIAVGRYRLWDIDVVVNKTVMLAVLVAVIAGLYVAIVVGLGSLVGAGDQPHFGLQVAATALVAIAFGPVRHRAQQWANRAVYGERATPYEVLARFSHRAAEASDDDLLGRLPKLIVDGTSAVQATLWVKSHGQFRSAASWPQQGPRPGIVDGESFLDPAADYSLPVDHDGALLGGLSLVRARGEDMPPDEEQLIENLAAGIGLALRNAALTAQLRDQVAELEASRDRVLAAADEARRTLERDLDSGPQQQLVALKVMLGPTRKQAAQLGAAKTAKMLAQLEVDAGEAIRAVREFSGGIYPPLLEAEGLAVAITQQTRKSTLPIDVQSSDLDRYSPEVEAAVYFTILEALQNVAKYAAASRARVVLRQERDTLHFEVTDDGSGFDPLEVGSGSGLANMSDRLDAVRGTWELDSKPGLGTTVRGTVPIGSRIRNG